MDVPTLMLPADRISLEAWMPLIRCLAGTMDCEIKVSFSLGDFNLDTNRRVNYLLPVQNAFSVSNLVGPIIDSSFLGLSDA